MIRYSGTPRPINTSGLNSGVIKVTAGTGSRSGGNVAVPKAKATSSPTANAASTAIAGLRNRTSKNAAIIGRIRSGKAWAASAPCTQNGSNTPASIAAAIPSGIIAISLPKGRNAPVRAINTPARRNAPTPSAIVTPLVAAINAAPGVDQASTTGIWAKALRNADPTALPRHSTKIQLAVCAGVADRAVAAEITMATLAP